MSSDQWQLAGGLVEAQMPAYYRHLLIGHAGKINATIDRRYTDPGQVLEQSLETRVITAHVHLVRSQPATAKGSIIIDSGYSGFSRIRIEIQQVVVTVAIHLPGKQIRPFQIVAFPHDISSGRRKQSLSEERRDNFRG